MAREKSTPPPAAGGKQRWYKQLWQVYRLTARHDRRTPLYLLGTVVVVAGLAFGATVLFGGAGWLSLVIGIVLALTLGVLAAMIVLARLADRAVYAQLEGQPGATGFAFEQIKRGWWVEREPIAVDPRTKDLVFRAVGRPGIVLVTEGPLPRVLRLAENERKRHARVASGAPVHVLHVGTGEDQIRLRRLPGRMRRLPRALTSAEVSAVGKRMAALRTNKPPVPKGIDPLRARPDRRAVKGR